MSTVNHQPSHSLSSYLWPMSHKWPLNVRMSHPVSSSHDWHAFGVSVIASTSTELPTRKILPFEPESGWYRFVWCEHGHSHSWIPFLLQPGLSLFSMPLMVGFLVPFSGPRREKTPLRTFAMAEPVCLWLQMWLPEGAGAPFFSSDSCDFFH
jgi:hypothetical protein